MLKAKRFVTFLIGFVLYIGINYSPLFGQDFEAFILALDSKNEKELKVLAEENEAKFKKTKDTYYLFNQKLALSHLSKLQGNTTEGIRLLVDILEACTDCKTTQISWARYHLASTLSYLNANKTSQEYLSPLLKDIDKEYNKSLRTIVINLVGTNYFRLGEYDKAIKFYTQSYLSYDEKAYLMKASMLNNIGLSFQFQNDFDKSLEIFYKAKKTIDSISNQNTGDQFMAIVVEGNIGTTYHFLGNYPEAIRFLSKENNYYRQRPEFYVHSEGPLCELFELYPKTGKIEEAIKLINYANQVDSVLEKISVKTPREPKLLNCLYNFYKNTNNHAKSIEFADKLALRQTKYVKEVKNQSEELTEILYRNQLDNLISKNRIQEFETLKERQQKRNIYWVSISILTVLIIISIFVFYNLRQRKNAIEKDALIAEQQAQIEITKNVILQNELDIQHEKVNSLTQNLSLKKETEKAFLSKINEIKRNKNKDPEQAILELQLSVNTLLGVDKRLAESKLSVETANENFIKVLKRKHPGLTKSDLELLVLFRMKLSSKDIGAIKNMSSGTIRVYKSKLKTKLNLKNEDNLENYLNDIVN